MPKTIYRDFDEFAEAINGMAGRIVPTARPESDWWVQVIPVGRVAMQQVQIGGAATFAGDGTENALTLGIPVSDSHRIRIDGDSMQDNSFVMVKKGQPFTFAADQATRWTGITVPMDHASLSPELVESLRSRTWGRRNCTRAQTELPHITRTKQLILRLCAEDGNVSFLDEAAVISAEDEIVSIASQTLEVSNRPEDGHMGRPRYSRSLVLARALALMEESQGQPLFMRDLCRATQVSERTLRNIFQEYFSVGPTKMMRVRQLGEIRIALLAANQIETSVTAVAARFGVWDFSLLARNYKALYGETPSTTLNRPATPRDRHNAMNESWIRFAAHKFQHREWVMSH